MVDVAMPFMALWQEMETWTSGDGYLDKLCMELLGLGSSRCRPPTRDAPASDSVSRHSHAAPDRGAASGGTTGRA